MTHETLPGGGEGLVVRWAGLTDPEELVAEAVPVIAERGPAWALALAAGPAVRVVAGSGRAPAADDVELLELPAETTGSAAPGGWPDVSSYTVERLPYGVRLVVGWPGSSPEPGPPLDEALAWLRALLGQLETRDQLADLTERVDNAQQLAGMGDYDWHIATDTNRWSDHLFRIYGYEPGEIDPSYERFLAHIHPDDRERIQRIHQRAYATGEPYQMMERIVRPDGELRYLSSNGQVVQDAAGTPVRMRGTCVDVTDQVLAKEAEERSARRFRALVESCPDAILVVDRTGTVVQANGQATELLGGAPTGRPLADLLPDPAPGRRLGVPGRGVDGRQLQLDVTMVVLSEEERLQAAFLHDSAPRLHGEQVAARLREVQVRRRQALELNDSVVQGLVTAILSMNEGDHAAVSRSLSLTLSAARRMMNEWLAAAGGTPLEAIDLVRSTPSSLGGVAGEEEARQSLAPRPAEAADLPARPGSPVTVLVVEDNEDLRRLVARRLDLVEDFEVVGQAADGEEAVEMVARLRPGIVMLDLAMPRMDGLTALPLILAAVPETRVIVLSGFDEQTMADRAIEAGAHAYLEKGPGMDLVGVVREVIEVHCAAGVG